MSFDVNVLSSKPVIKAAANMQNDGGGGNLGYMRQGGQKGKKEQEYEPLFIGMNQHDVVDFQKEIPLPDEEIFSLKKLLKQIIEVMLKVFHRY